MTGRPTDCTPEVTEAVCAELREGLSIASACAAGGIARSTYHDWLQRASEGPPFSDFRDATTKARAVGTRSLEVTVRTAALDDWRAAAWMLERKAPEDWSKRTEITGKDGGPVEVHNVTAMIDAELAARTPDALGIPASVLGADGQS
jgi:transposase-like protein